MTLAQARMSIGAEVIYSPCPDCRWGSERGTIASVSATCVFVQYARGGPKATPPGRLNLAASRDLGAVS